MTLEDHLALDLQDEDGVVVTEDYKSLKSAAQRALAAGGDDRDLAGRVFVPSEWVPGRVPRWYNGISERAPDKVRFTLQSRALTSTFNEMTKGELPPEGDKALSTYAATNGTGRVARVGSESL